MAQADRSDLTDKVTVDAEPCSNELSRAPVRVEGIELQPLSHGAASQRFQTDPPRNIDPVSSSDTSHQGRVPRVSHQGFGGEDSGIWSSKSRESHDDKSSLKSDVLKGISQAVSGISSHQSSTVLPTSKSSSSESPKKCLNMVPFSLDDVNIEDDWHLLSDKLKIDYYDAMILYQDNDKEKVKRFLKRVDKEVILNGKVKPKIGLYDEIMPSSGMTPVGELEIIVPYCTYVFLFITKDFCKDIWTEFSGQACLMNTINSKDSNWSVVPIFTEPRRHQTFKIPITIQCLKGIHYWSEDKFYVDSLRKLLEDKLDKRLDKDKERESARRIYIFEQKNKRQREEFDRRQREEQAEQQERVKNEQYQLLHASRDQLKFQITSDDEMLKEFGFTSSPSQNVESVRYMQNLLEHMRFLNVTKDQSLPAGLQQRGMADLPYVGHNPCIYNSVHDNPINSFAKDSSKPYTHFGSQGDRMCQRNPSSVHDQESSHLGTVGDLNKSMGSAVLPHHSVSPVSVNTPCYSQSTSSISDEQYHGWNAKSLPDLGKRYGDITRQANPAFHSLPMASEAHNSTISLAIAKNQSTESGTENAHCSLQLMSGSHGDSTARTRHTVSGNTESFVRMELSGNDLTEDLPSRYQAGLNTHRMESPYLGTGRPNVSETATGPTFTAQIGAGVDPRFCSQPQSREHLHGIQAQPNNQFWGHVHPPTYLGPPSYLTPTVPQQHPDPGHRAPRAQCPPGYALLHPNQEHAGQYYMMDLTHQRLASPQMPHQPPFPYYWTQPVPHIPVQHVQPWQYHLPLQVHNHYHQSAEPVPTTTINNYSSYFKKADNVNIAHESVRDRTSDGPAEDITNQYQPPIREQFQAVERERQLSSGNGQRTGTSYVNFHHAEPPASQLPDQQCPAPITRDVGVYQSHQSSMLSYHSPRAGLTELDTAGLQSPSNQARSASQLSNMESNSQWLRDYENSEATNLKTFIVGSAEDTSMRNDEEERTEATSQGSA